jgi:(p)ppGpp synthase/HD superfamily hydrolase
MCVLGSLSLATIEDSISFIQEAHAGRLTKGGEPYWTHPVAVMKLLPADASEDERHAALLHDVIEDTKFTADDLRRRGYSDETITIVKLVSRPAKKPRPPYIEWIVSTIVASGNRGAMRIKLADNQHNMQPDRVAKLPDAERDLVKRYERSARILEKALQY